jgi:hypothetical protein
MNDFPSNISGLLVWGGYFSYKVFAGASHISQKCHNENNDIPKENISGTVGNFKGQ